MPALVRTAFGPWAVRPRDKIQRTVNISRRRRARDVSSCSDGLPDGNKSSSDEVSSPRSTVGALSKDETFIGLIIVTAIVSTNRFFQKLSGLVDPLESAGDSAAADGSTKKTSATPQSTESQTSVPETLPSPSAVMNVTLQADTGETHISLSSSDLLYDTSQGDGTKDERYEDFFDVAAAAVRGAMVDERQDDGPQGSGSDTASSGDADPLQEGPGASSSENDNREIQKWISASEARASRSKNTGDQGDPSQSGARASETTEVPEIRNSPLQQQRPGARRPLGTSLKSETVDPAESGPSPVVPATADPASTALPEGSRDEVIDSVGTPVAPTTSSSGASPGVPEELKKTSTWANVSSGTGTTNGISATSEASTKQSIPSTEPDATTSGAAQSGLRAPAASTPETWPDRVWPQPPPPLGSVDNVREPALAATGAGAGVTKETGSGDGSDRFGGGGGDGGSGGGGDGGPGGGGSSQGGGDESSGRFPWVPVLFFLLAAATYPILRDASEARKDSDGVDGDNPFQVFAGGLLSVKNKLLQPLRGGDHDPHALRAAQQDAYAVKVAEHQAGGEGGKGGLAGILSGSGRKLPDSWGSRVTKSADDHEENKQRWWLIIPLLAVAGIAGYAWWKFGKGAGEGSNSAVEGSVHGGKDAGASFCKPAAPTTSASASNPDVPGQTPRSRDPPAESAPSTGSHQHDDPHLDPRHLSQEVSQLYAKLVQRDIEYSTLAKQLADLENQEASLRAASAADTQAVRKQIAEMRDALKESDVVGS